MGLYTIRRSNATRSDYHVIILRHAPDSLNDFSLIVCDDLNPPQIDTKGEAELGKICLFRLASNMYLIVFELDLPNLYQQSTLK